ncbi:polyubiquitin-tagged protein recognition complex, Npl4 component [Cylindrobasidium torrendii FP15055 ss-10]|uniref:Nuclear protein localization protein 4 n=1 Tax=Cylindrobasidium torrendii FP15055 ss-10 TaxID=1314674 RepID=A0A0D7BB98_9AGAR|nr:polyubiquitin-tagged protein recognition complex, Npl4 component [Cylindrobasidium torrendii FP15055 ss-10]
MLLRLRSKEGNFRFQFDPAADISVLLNKIIESSPNADPNTITISDQPRGNEVPLLSLSGRTIQHLGLNNGDLIFIQYKELAGATESTSTPTTLPSSSTGVTREPKAWELAQEDPVDTFWRSKDGKIPRNRDTTFCKHGPKGMCDYCMPLEPYDAAYHKENSIKHLSFHAYLKKISPKTDNSSASFLPPLDPPSYTVKSPCPVGGHSPFPAGICTSCQPSAITLQSQPFRMVDHLEIANMDIVDRFLNAWRRTGMQRFGWMIGHYEPYPDVPMGVKAIVEAIYEPPQAGELDGLTLGIPWEDEQRLRQLIANASTPLSVVGYIFTDLEPMEEDRTKNVYKRHPDSFFLSSLEAVFAATLQNASPTSTKSSPTGKYSSRLVTAILTATEDGAIDVSAYQVSAQAEAMVAADMIEPSVDPGIVRVKENDRTSGSARYVPDVFFSYKNEYGLEVKKSAKPAFPVEYLIVNVTHGFPQNPSPMFRSSAYRIENRPGLEDQTIESVLAALAGLGAPDIPSSQLLPPGQAHKTFELAKFLSDLHLIAFLQTTQLVSEEDIKVWLKTVTSPTLLDDPRELDPVLATEGWQSLMTFTRESAPAPGRPSNAMDEDISEDILRQIAEEQAGNNHPSSSSVRVCPHCTFENDHSGTDCEVCGLPLA